MSFRRKAKSTLSIFQGDEKKVIDAKIAAIDEQIALIQSKLSFMKAAAAKEEEGPAATGAEKQTILAEGIAEALTATSYGLSTALLCLLIHGIYSIKQQAILATINHSAAKMLDLLYTRKTKGSVKS